MRRAGDPREGFGEMRVAREFLDGGLQITVGPFELTERQQHAPDADIASAVVWKLLSEQ